MQVKKRYIPLSLFIIYLKKNWFKYILNIIAPLYHKYAPEHVKQHGPLVIQWCNTQIRKYTPIVVQWANTNVKTFCNIIVEKAKPSENKKVPPPSTNGTSDASTSETKEKKEKISEKN